MSLRGLRKPGLKAKGSTRAYFYAEREYGSPCLYLSYSYFPDYDIARKQSSWEYLCEQIQGSSIVSLEGFSLGILSLGILTLMSVLLSNVVEEKG